LPGLTEAMLGNTWLLPLALVLLAVVLIGYFKGVTIIRRRLSNLEPLRPALRWVPGFAAWAAMYDAGLWMRYQAILLDAGADSEAARTGATNLAGEPALFEQRRQLLDSAAQLGRLRQELGEQIARAELESLDYFETPRNSMVLLIRALIYLLLSSYIIAMYLPIFKLGAIV
jgi:type II secretory pathway component PulF